MWFGVILVWCMWEIKLISLKIFWCIFSFFTLHYPRKTKFSIKNFFSKCDDISKKLQSWSHLLKKSLKGDFIFEVCTAGGKVFQASSKNLEGSYLQEEAVMKGLAYCTDDKLWQKDDILVKSFLITTSFTT